MNSMIFPKNKINRRNFMRLAALLGVSALAAGCRSETPPSPTPLPSPVLHSQASAVPTQTPLPLPTSSPNPTVTATQAWKARVAIEKVTDYQPAPLRKALERMLDGLGGLADLVKPGARVGIKVNLTGGTWWDTPDKPPAIEYFVTHPAVVAALCGLLRDAGAKELMVVDGLGDETSFSAWGYTEMAAALDVKLVDLCKPDPFNGYFRFPVGTQARVYEYFYMNNALRDLDLFISVAKMKCHTTTGVTHSLKNLFGLVPISEYRRSPQDNHRSAFHESTDFDRRVPRVILDLNQARPVQLALIDGVMTAEGGAGPWDAGMSQVKPGLLVAGKDPVAADAVATALMGFDPLAEAGTSPFMGSENHLNLARDAGMGTNRLDEIGISGPAISEVTFPFRPAR